MKLLEVKSMNNRYCTCSLRNIFLEPIKNVCITVKKQTCNALHTGVILTQIQRKRMCIYLYVSMCNIWGCLFTLPSWAEELQSSADARKKALHMIWHDTSKVQSAHTSYVCPWCLYTSVGLHTLHSKQKSTQQNAQCFAYPLGLIVVLERTQATLSNQRSLVRMHSWIWT